MISVLVSIGCDYHVVMKSSVSDYLQSKYGPEEGNYYGGKRMSRWYYWVSCWQLMRWNQQVELERRSLLTENISGQQQERLPSPRWQNLILRMKPARRKGSTWATPPWRTQPGHPFLTQLASAYLSSTSGCYDRGTSLIVSPSGLPSPLQLHLLFLHQSLSSQLVFSQPLVIRLERQRSTCHRSRCFLFQVWWNPLEFRP